MIILTIMTLVFLSFILAKSFEDFYFDIKKNEMINEGQQLVSLILRGIDPEEFLDISKFINAHAIIVDKQELIRACSNISRFDGLTLGGKGFGEVLKGNIVVHKGYIRQFNASMLTVALPIKTERDVIGGVILYSPMSSIQASIWQIRRLIMLAALGAVGVATILSFILSKTISTPLVQMKKVAEDMAEGDFTSRIEIKSKDEVGSLGKSLNHLSEALQNNISALSQEKNQLQKVLLSMTDGVITFDANNQVLMANPQAQQLFQKDIDKGQDYLKKIYPLLDECKNIQRPIQKEVKLDGNIISVKLIPLNGEEEQEVLSVIQDVTMERKLEDLRRKFVSNVSHELRTPLTYLQGYTEALLDGMAQEPEEKNRYLNIILEETLRLRRLVDELLDLSLIEGGHFTLNKEKTSLQKLIARVMHKLYPLSEEKELQLISDVEELPLVKIDEDRVEQVLINLIDNAIRHSPEGGAVKIQAKHHNNGILVAIKDQGGGIPEEELPFVWERFYKVDKARTRNTSGTGLGLAIAKNIIELHGGRIGVKNSKTRGAIFYFYLPIE